MLFAERDGYGNHAHTWSLARHTFRGAVRAAGMVETHASPWLVDEAGAPPVQIYLRATELTPIHPKLAELGRKPLADGLDPRSLIELGDVVRDRVAYRTGATTVRTTALEALTLGAGVCQDQAHVFIAACRSNGIPARYVSGYFYAPDSPALASHAWADVCVDTVERRWLSVDITHGCLMDERHVRPELRQLRVDEGRDPERRCGGRHGIGGTWTLRPRVEPGRHALTEQDRQPEARSVIGTPLSQRHPPQRFVTRHERGGRRLPRGDVGRIAQRRFFSSRRKARSRLRGWTSRPKRS